MNSMGQECPLGLSLTFIEADNFEKLKSSSDVNDLIDKYAAQNVRKVYI